MPDNKNTPTSRRKFIKAAGAVTAATGLGFPFISRAQNKPIRIGMPTILSGRVAQLGISSRNAVMMLVDQFNAAGGASLLRRWQTAQPAALGPVSQRGLQSGCPDPVRSVG